jgi:hypothetical protein
MSLWNRSLSNKTLKPLGTNYTLLYLCISEFVCCHVSRKCELAEILSQVGSIWLHIQEAQADISVRLQAIMIQDIRGFSQSIQDSIL